MKTLMLVRHAKSSWADFGQADFDRPLNERGKRDAPAMAGFLKNKQIQIDAFVSSPAKRAKKTCKAFCEVYGYDKDEIIFIEKLYHASKDTFESVVEDLFDDHDRVAIFSHNPGITEFANSLSPEVHLDNMPTCAVFAVQADVERWADFNAAKKEFLFFETPKTG
ncbi:MAG: phosphohistidine phosphatase [Ferruginibacter sp.]|nr:phosphohistidine phosphatase [Ferruginibacter sp.]